MKGVKCFGLLLALSIIFGLSLSVFSENTNAVDFTVSVEPTGNSYNVGTDLRCTLDYQFNISTITANQHGECNIPWSGTAGPTYVRNVLLNRNISVQEGNYYSFFLGYQNGDTPLSDVLWNLNTDNSKWTIFQFEEVTNDRMKDICYSWFAGQSPSYTCGGLSSAENWNSKYFMVTMRAKVTGDVMPILGNLQGSPRSFMIVYGGQISMSTIFEFKPGAMEEMNQKDNEDRDNIESQQSDSQDGADDSQQEAESTGATLLSAFTAFVGALTNASPSNCNIDMDLGNLDLGRVNLCQLSPPAGFQAIASIFMILFCVPLSIATARKVISLFRSFQT